MKWIKAEGIIKLYIKLEAKIYANTESLLLSKSATSHEFNSFQC